MNPIDNPYAPGAGTRPPELAGRDELQEKARAALARTRNAIIGKGMIWSPDHGDTAFTVPLFDQNLKRIMPGNDWSI